MLPRSSKNPAGGSRGVSQAIRSYEGKLSVFRKRLFDLLDTIPVEETGVPEPEADLVVNAKRYLYQVEPTRLLETVRALFEQVVGGAAEGMASAARSAYTEGAATAERSMRTLLDDTRDLTRTLSDNPFLQRAAFVKARVFEEMRGFVGETASKLGSTLLEGMLDGKSIASIKATLRDEFKISTRRAETIARTEVIGALRRGRVEQAEATAEQFGVQVGLMWFSALSDTTRKSHADLHGKVLTPDEVKAFYTEDGNAINCKCSQVEVLMKDGKPIQEKLVARETARRKSYLKEEGND